MLRGWVRDRLVRAGGTETRSGWRPNLVVRSGLDLVGALLCELEGADGVAWLAVGSGDPGWDTVPPPRDLGRTSLAAEVARVHLEPGTRQLSYDDEGGRLVVRATLGPGVATGTLRETGLFGGTTASILAGSGVLVNHQAHPAIDKGPADVLHRDVALVLGDGLGPGARELIGRLLARRPGTRGLTHVALGTGAGGGDAGRLDEERWRAPLDPREVRYDERTATVVVRVRVEPGEALAEWPVGDGGPRPVREIGLLGGDAGRGGGLLVARAVVDLPPPDDPRPIEHTTRLVLAARADVPVPDLTGLDVAVARSQLQPDLVLGRVSERVVVGVAGGTVVAQEPPAGTVVNEATAVDVQIVRPPAVVVPEVLHLALDRARSALRRRDLVVAEPVASSEVGPGGPPRDTVVACDPSPGRRVPRDSEVRLTIAVPAEVRTPDVRGRSRFGAEVELRRAGFGGEIEWKERADRGTVGTVVFQRPAPGSRAPLDAALELTIATSATVEVPAVVGLDVAEAARLIDEAGRAAVADDPDGGPPGLAIGAIRPIEGTAPVGTVGAQRPAAGAPVNRYGVVELDVVIGAVAPVPHLVGLDELAAAASLGGAGLRLGRVARRPGREAPGTVVAQEPTAGRPLPTGLPVDVVVAVAATVPVPHLFGFGPEAATEALTARGLALGPIATQLGGGSPGTIVANDPAEGAVVELGTEVAITLADGVPALVGVPRADAEARLAAAGLDAVVEEIESPGPVGIVVSQAPAAGEPVPADRRIALGVSVAQRVEVPDVRGEPPQRAAQRLDAVGLRSRVQGTEPGPNDQFAEGSVRRQQPPRRERVPRGTTVSLWLRAAVDVPVPDVRQLSIDQAQQAIRDAQLTPSVGPTISTVDVPEGAVVEQEPAAGALVPRFTTVVLHAASRAAVTVPDVRLLSPEDAAARLRAAWLAVVERDLLGDLDPNRAEPRIVRDQVPPAGSTVPAGTEVTIELGGSLPDLVGTSAGMARKRAAAIGLLVTEIGMTSRLAPDTVISTEPRAGAVYAPGDLLTLTVATSPTEVPPWIIDPRERIVVVEPPLPDPGPRLTGIDLGVPQTIERFR